jgi:eukaryotic-like serine/threonine-protein kinase
MMIDLSAHYAAIDNVSEQLALLDRAAALAARAHDDETAANAECSIALVQAGRENTTAARPHHERGLGSLARVREPAVRARMQCLLAQAQIAIADGPEDSALPLARRAVALAEAAGDTASVAYADALATVATQLHNQNRVRDALDATRRTVATLERIGRGSTLPMLDARLDEARFFRDLGEMRTADSVLGDVVRLAQRIDARYVAAKVSILAGEVAQGRDRPDSAVAALESALAEARRTGDAYRAQWALERLVAVLADYGRVEHGRKRLAELTAIIPEDDRAMLGMLEARFAATGGDPPRAFRTYMAALAERGFPSDPDIPPWHRIVFRAAQAALASGDAIAADSLARHAIRLEHALGGDDRRSGDIGLALVVLARARLAQGDSGGARDALERATAPLEYGFGPDDRRTREARRLLESGRLQ